MSISGLPFLLFLAAALLVYYLFPLKHRWMVLLAASLVFYLSVSVRAGLWLGLTAALSWGAALLLERMTARGAAQAAQAEKDACSARKKRTLRRKRLLLGAVLVLCFGLLAAFKYAAAWLGDLERVLRRLGFGVRFRPLELLLPLGISFYTFQTAGYLFDVYRGKAQAERNFFRYALFVCWFPQMLQGPISRFGQLHGQLMEGHRFDPENLRDGLQLMIFGLLKKVFLADVLAAGVAEIYAHYNAYSGVIVFLGAALYCIQLYADFSGGTDMVRGISQMFGITLIDNFRRPYFAVSVADFWRRWHISLGDWMTDYLFYPMALSKRMGRLTKKLRPKLGQRVSRLLVPSIATVVVFLAVGVWQGPGMSNIAYGLWNGLLMSGATLCAPLFEKLNARLHIPEKRVGMRVFRVLRTFLLIVIGRYFSRSDSLHSALGMLRRTVTRPFTGLTLHSFFSFGLSKWGYLTAFLACCVLFVISLLQERGIDVRGALAKKSAVLQFVLLFAAVLLLVMFVYLDRGYTAVAFIYENV